MPGGDGKNGWRDEELADCVYIPVIISVGYYARVLCLYVFARQAGNLKNVNQWTHPCFQIAFNVEGKLAACGTVFESKCQGASVSITGRKYCSCLINQHTIQDLEAAALKVRGCRVGSVWRHAGNAGLQRAGFQSPMAQSLRTPAHWQTYNHLYSGDNLWTAHGGAVGLGLLSSQYTGPIHSYLIRSALAALFGPMQVRILMSKSDLLVELAMQASQRAVYYALAVLSSRV